MSTVTALALAPVKGMRLVAADALTITPSGVEGDRELLLVDAADHTLVLTSRARTLLQVVPAWDRAALALELAFPDGTTVRETLRPGEAAVTHNYEGRELRGRLVDDGPASQAVSAFLDRPVRLLLRDPDVTGTDDFPVTVMSGASLAALAEAPAIGGAVPDPRRFRMSIAIDGVGAWEEHGWGGREIAVGETVLRGVDPVVRCVITTRHPDTGKRDVMTLKGLAELRGRKDVTFGLWCDVVRPGVVRVGDPVSPRAAA